MPQMSPLMWSYLYLIFSFMLLLSMIKIYFSSSKLISNAIETDENIKTIKTNSWAW